MRATPRGHHDYCLAHDARDCQRPGCRALRKRQTARRVRQAGKRESAGGKERA